MPLFLLPRRREVLPGGPEAPEGRRRRQVGSRSLRGAVSRWALYPVRPDAVSRRAAPCSSGGPRKTPPLSGSAGGETGGSPCEINPPWLVGKESKTSSNYAWLRSSGSPKALWYVALPAAFLNRVRSAARLPTSACPDRGACCCSVPAPRSPSQPLAPPALPLRACCEMLGIMPLFTHFPSHKCVC